ncbi:unnamed protein product [Moneuplotes crassus]|uniref:Uncharacterized protein n=1 Tax=Euplotes crassus TaxID=5936 RepID=A0AAD1Y5N9_EUPCR|nr:unnamed protein product [Moneuplotes crassus]
MVSHCYNRTLHMGINSVDFELLLDKQIGIEEFVKTSLHSVFISFCITVEVRGAFSHATLDHLKMAISIAFVQLQLEVLVPLWMDSQLCMRREEMLSVHLYNKFIIIQCI